MDDHHSTDKSTENVAEKDSTENVNKYMIEEIIDLNVGGRKFTTSRNTLCSVPNTFFTAMLTSGLPSFRDKTGAIFIDRDPDLFSIILNYLRTNKLYNVNDENIESLIDEAKFFCITPLIKKLELRQNFVSTPSCGDNILFESLLKSNQRTPVKQLIPFDRGLAVVYNHLIKFYYYFFNNNEWKCISDFTYTADEIELVDFVWEIAPMRSFLLAIYSKEIILWDNIANYINSYHDTNERILRVGRFSKIGHYNLENCEVDTLFFIRSQLVTFCTEKGRIGIWKNSRLFEQELKENDNVSKITAINKTKMDFLFFGSNGGRIYSIDMQKLPFRLSDGDLLINEFYKDPDDEPITAISCLCSFCSNFTKCSHFPCEVAYGTESGAVHILVIHSSSPFKTLLFHTIRVHLCPIWKIITHQKYLMTICSKLHVRTWSLVRFRGTLSTQPGLEPESNYAIRCASNIDKFHDIGPYGHQEVLKEIIVEIPYNGCNYANLVCAFNGKKLCTLESVDGSRITSVGGLSIDIRYRTFIFTGHDNGNVQVWDPNPAINQKLEKKDIDNNIGS